jgi:hypothetical protein
MAALYGDALRVCCSTRYLHEWGELDDQPTEPGGDDEAVVEVELPEHVRAATEPGGDDEAVVEVELPEHVRAAVEEFRASRAELDQPATDRHRKFDRLYRVLNWIAFSKLGKRMPDRIRTPLFYVTHLIAIYDNHRRQVAREYPFFSKEDDFSVPSDEHITMPALFVIEMFPPSEIHNLQRALRKGGWNANELRFFPESTPRLEDARSGAGWAWWKLGAVVRPNSPTIIPDAKCARLPHEFDAVELKALQIGQGITAVMACFYLRNEASTRVDASWHAEYHPRIFWGKRGQWPQAFGPDWFACRATQRARGSIHQAARRWFRQSCPGIFAANDQPQPLIDILLFDKHEAALNEQPSREFDDALRAVGVTEDATIQRSRQIPAMVLEPASRRGMNLAFETSRTWGLWGKRDAILDSIAERIKYYGTGRSDSSITHYVHRAIEDYFLRLSISELLTLCQSRHAALRDTARQRHGKFNMGHLRDLRSSILTLSLDVSSIAHDARTYHARSWRFDRVQFVLQDAPWMVARHEQNGFPSLEPINLNERLFTEQMRTLETLVAADSDYRGILTAAASLTSSMRALRAGMVAGWIAVASLVVALTALLLSDTAAHTRLSQLVDWISSW